MNTYEAEHETIITDGSYYTTKVMLKRWFSLEELQAIISSLPLLEWQLHRQLEYEAEKYQLGEMEIHERKQVINAETEIYYRVLSYVNRTRKKAMDINWEIERYGESGGDV